MLEHNHNWAEIALHRSTWLELIDALIGGNLQGFDESELSTLHELGVQLQEWVNSSPTSSEQRLSRRVGWDVARLVRRSERALQSLDVAA